MRIIKAHDERRNEIIDIAENLFHTKGYEKCTVNDILKEIGIAKGTFYHYFNSKEEVLDALVLKYKEIIVARAERIHKEDLDPAIKLLSAFMSMNMAENISNEDLEKMHKTENALLHQKILNMTIKTMAPILSQIVEEGMNKGAWSCKFPLEYMQIFLAASLTLTDEGIYELDKDSFNNVMVALIFTLEKMLEVQEGIFMKLFMENQRQ